MTKTSPTPPDLAIRPRDRAFFRGETNSRHWLGGDPIASAFYNALSATFPLGERFFMDAVRHYAHLADPKLKAQIAAFTTQEAVHSREHVLFNKLVADSGYNMAEMEARTRSTIDFARTQHAIAQLAATVALEHFTAILAHALLSDPRHLANASEEARGLWRWHAMEEIEHKAVAFDTLLIATRDLPGRRRWTMRVITMWLATHMLFSNVFASMAAMFRSDGINGIRTWGRVVLFLFGSPGILRQALPAYLSYFLPGFHPWKHDDRSLIAENELAVAAA